MVGVDGRRGCRVSEYYGCLIRIGSGNSVSRVGGEMSHLRGMGMMTELAFYWFVWKIWILVVLFCFG